MIVLLLLLVILIVVSLGISYVTYERNWEDHQAWGLYARYPSGFLDYSMYYGRISFHKSPGDCVKAALADMKNSKGDYYCGRECVFHVEDESSSIKCTEETPLIDQDGSISPVTPKVLSPNL